jgi:hypothetical protein
VQIEIGYHCRDRRSRPSHDGGRPVTVYTVERSPEQGRRRQNVYIWRSTASIDVRAVRASPSQATQVERDTPLLTGYVRRYALGLGQDMPRRRYED